MALNPLPKPIGPTFGQVVASQRKRFEMSDQKIRARDMRFWKSRKRQVIFTNGRCERTTVTKSMGWQITFENGWDGALPMMVFNSMKAEKRMKEWLAANIAHDHFLSHGWIDFESEEDALMCFLRWR